MAAEVVEIRVAAAEDHPALLVLLRRSALANPSHRADLLANPDALCLPAGLIAASGVMIAEHDRRIAGFLALSGDPGEPEIDGLFVEPALWRRGIGRALVDDAVRRAAADGARALTVVAGAAGEGFYRACGFERTGTCDTRFRPALTMRLCLRRDQPVERVAEVPGAEPDAGPRN